MENMFLEKKIVDSKTKERMKEVLKDIQSGKFAKQWMDECKGGQKNFLKMREELAKHPIEKVGTFIENYNENGIVFNLTEYLDTYTDVNENYIGRVD